MCNRSSFRRAVSFVLALAVATPGLLAPSPSLALSRIKDLAQVEGVRQNQDRKSVV